MGDEKFSHFQKSILTGKMKRCFAKLRNLIDRSSISQQNNSYFQIVIHGCQMQTRMTSLYIQIK